MTKPRRSLENRGKSTNYVTTGSTAINRNRERKLEYHPEEDYYYGSVPFKITVTGKNKKKRPYWVSPKGAGNMTVMPGDQEMVFFAPIAAGAAVAASPAIASALGSTMSGINTVGDAVTATAAGQRLTSGLNFVGNAIRSSKAWPWIDTGLTSAFGAHGIDKVVSGDVHNVEDVVETGLDLLPLSQLARPVVNTSKTVYNAAKSAINRTVTTLQNNYPALFDPYTSWDATLGYHGDNIVSRTLGTIGRRHNFTPKAETPEFHRRLRIYKPKEFRMTDDGKFIMSSNRTGEGHDNIVNFATSEPARSHSKHKTLSGIDDFILNPKAIKGVEFKSIQPSDTFFEVPELAVNPKDVTLVSGNTETLNYARSLGMRTLSSPRLRSLFMDGIPKEEIINSRSTEGIGKFLFNISKGRENSGEIGAEIQRLTSMRGAPTIKDYAYFEDVTGLNSGVIPNNQFNSENAKTILGRWGSVRRTPTFNNVIYTPATNIEAIYRKAKMGEIPWGDYFEALKGLPSAKLQVESHSVPWRFTVPKNENMAYRIMGPLERDWILEGNELSTRATNPLTELEEKAARVAASKRRFNIFKAGAEHGGRKQFAKGQPWSGTTTTHGEHQILAIPGNNLPWVSGRHYKGVQGHGFNVGKLSFEEVPFGSHIDIMADEAGFTGINPSMLPGSVMYSPFNIFGKHFGYRVRPIKRDGGSIHIAPSKRGTFTAAASKHGMGVQEFASRVLKNKENYSPAMVKKANFARNASKWNH